MTDLIKQIDFYLDHWGGDTLVQNILQQCRETIKNMHEGFEGCCQTCEPVGVMNRELVELVNKLRYDRDQARAALQENAMQYLSDQYQDDELLSNLNDAVADRDYWEREYHTLENKCDHLETDRNNLSLRVQKLEQTLKQFELMCREAVHGRQG